MVRLKQLCLLIFLTTSLSLSGQDFFDRLYRSDMRLMQGMNIDAAEDGTYYMLSRILKDDDNPPGINVTKLSAKGDVDWSFDFQLKDSVEIFDVGEIHQTVTGDIYFNTIVNDSVEVHEKVIVKLDPSGNIEWANGYSAEDELLDDYDDAYLEEMPDSTLVHFGVTNVDGGRRLLGFNIDSDGNSLWSRTYENTQSAIPEDDALGDLIVTRDSMMMIAGSLGDAGSKRMYLSKMDFLGNVEWSREYGSDGPQRRNLNAYNVTEAADSSFYLVGAMGDDQGSSPSSQGIVIKTDSIGNLEWSKIINFGVGVFSTLTNAVALDDGGILLQGSYRGATDANNFIIKIDTSGAILESRQYAQETVMFNQINELKATADGGAVFVNFEADDPFSANNEIFPHVMKLTEGAQTSCELELVIDTLVDFSIVQDTSMWETEVTGAQDTIAIASQRFSRYNIPVLSLRDTMYCPDDPVMFLLDATTRGAVSYKWFKADDPDNVLSTDSVFIATEVEVNYVVDVRVEEETCYNLCDTTMLTLVPEPMLQMVPGFGQWCSDRIILLAAQATGQIESFEWSTGQTGSIIQVTDFGSYSAKITDICGRVVEQSISLGPNDPPQPDPLSIIVGNDNLCSTGELLLTATGSTMLSNIVWNDGSNTQQISVPGPGTYSVSAVDDCGYTVDASVAIDDGDFLQPVTIELEKDLDNCGNGNITLSAITGGSVNNVTWSTGQTGPTIVVSDEGTYSAIVRDICGDEESDQLDITTQELVDCGLSLGNCPEGTGEGCLCFPNVYLPTSTTVVNMRFQPVDQCGSVTDYTLRIYNRWGKKVFESTGVTTGWNGADGTTRLSSGVYAWYATYTSDGVDFNDKGTVTLIR